MLPYTNTSRNRRSPRDAYLEAFDMGDQGPVAGPLGLPAGGNTGVIPPSMRQGPLLSGPGPGVTGMGEEAADPTGPAAAPPPPAAGAGLPPRTGATGGVGDLIAPYQRRGGYGGSDPKRQAVASALVSSGNPYAMAAGGLGYLDAWLHRHAATRPTDLTTQDAGSAIRDAYLQALGRDPSLEEINAHLVNQGLNAGEGDQHVGEGGLQYVLSQILNSPEAQARAAAGPASTAAATAAPTTEETTPSGTPTAPGTTGRYRTNESMEGFDFGKFGTDSPKYRFASIVENFDPRQGLTPEVLARLNALGIGTFSGQGDKLHIEHGDPAFNGITDFDVATNFSNNGSGPVRWAWQPEGGGGTEEGGPAALTAGGGGGTSSDPLMSLLGGDSAFGEIMQALGMLTKGQHPVSVRQQILKGLGGPVGAPVP